MAKAGRRRAPLVRSLPIGYLVFALVLAVVLLPTALRPPQDEQSTSAAFSPDAPPDDTPPESLLSTLRQARSSTAGAAEVALEEEEEELALPPPPPPPRRRASRDGCFGDPPRQTESLYSALCVPAWVPPPEGNGGKTWNGVYPDEIRIALAVSLESDTPDGPLSREFSDADTPEMHDLKVWQTYFNERFETYGRYIQFYTLRQSTTNANQQRASVQMAKDNWDVFAMIGNSPDAVLEALRLGIMDFGSSNNPVPFYNEHFPLAYAFNMDSWQTRYMGTELVCKHYGGKPPGELNERMDEVMAQSGAYDKPRVFGLVSYQDGTRTGATTMIKELLARCGVEIKAAQEYNLTSNQQGLGGVMSKFRAEGVTTVILNVDGITPTLLTEEADRQSYFPEYVHTGTGEMDSAATGRLMNDRQARHVVGLSPNEIPRHDEDKDWYRAYKEVDPEGEPEVDYFRSLQQFVGGLQMAGPNLNPTTFWQGLSRQPYRAPNPEWSIGGGYRESFGFIAYKDLTYEDYMSLIWFDQNRKADGEDLVGAWCHMFNGRRFKVGELPAEPLPFRDPSQCIISPPRGDQG